MHIPPLEAKMQYWSEFSLRQKFDFFDMCSVIENALQVNYLYITYLNIY